MNRRQLLSLLPAVAMVPRALGAASPDVVAVDLLLEVDAALTERARALNARLRGREGRGFALDATHAAHVSIVQLFVRREDVAKLGDVISKVLEQAPAPTQLEVVGIDASPWNGSTMVSLRVESAPMLRHLQEAAVAGLIPLAAPPGDAAAFVRDPPETSIDAATQAYVSGFVLKQTGEKYQPHVTVGLASAALAATLEGEAFERQKFTVSGPAIYQLGNSGTARRKLWP